MELTDEQRIQASYDMSAMANLNPRDTGIKDVVVWISKGQGIPHACRVKVSNKHNSFSIYDYFSIPLVDGEPIVGEVLISPKELKQVRKWIEKNKKYILKYWYDADYSIADFLKKMKKV